MADLPQLIVPNKSSKLTQLLASASPKAPSSIKILSTPPSPTSPVKASRALSSKSPTKGSPALPKMDAPHRYSPSPNKISVSKARPIAMSSVPFPKTPSRHALLDDLTSLLTPKTPSVSPSRTNSGNLLPSTPVQQMGSNADTFPQTPTSSWRQALYERIRQKLLTSSPAKTPSKSKDIPGGKMSHDQLLKLSQEEMQHHVLLGWLEGIAKSVWM